MSATDYKYEILCVDSRSESSVKNEMSMRYALLSNSDIFLDPKISKRTILDNKRKISIDVVKVADKDNDNSIPSNTYLLNLKGDFHEIEWIRKVLLEHLSNLKMSHIYVLRDDVSSKIANNIYPLINDVENSLRRYLVKFFVTKIGPDWWEKTANKDMKQKAVNRKRNETVFSEFVDNNSYLIDFNELGKLIYAQSSGYKDINDIVTKVLETASDVDSFDKLKVEIQSNYNKFFKETFKDNKFQQSWERLEKIRHKVAHNNLFVLDDENEAKELIIKLNTIIDEADERIAELQLTDDEKADFQESIAVDVNYQKLSKEEMLRRIKRSYARTIEHNYDFLGLKSFVVSYLGGQGYDIDHSYEMIDLLEKDGELELYEHHGEGHLRSVRAIKVVNFDQKRYTTQQVENKPFSELKDMINA